MVTLSKIESALERISDSILCSPCQYSHYLSEKTSANVFLKLENQQKTGSFKERGALNKLLSLTPEQTKQGVVSASAGNHGQGLAFHATRLGISSTIFMPKHSPNFKVERTKHYGAHVRLEGENYDEAFDLAWEFARKCGATYVHAYNDEEVIAGQGTIGLEILRQLPDVEVILVPVGGGGLGAGIGTVIKSKKKDVRLIGVEPEHFAFMASAVKPEVSKPVNLQNTLADGMAVQRVGTITSPLCAKYFDEWIKVSDDEIAGAILALLEYKKTLAEGAGAATTAALLSGKIKGLRDKNVCVVLSGGNIDVNILARVIERGLVKTARLVRLEVMINDKPGSLVQLLHAATATGANLLEIHHERAFGQAHWEDVAVELVLQTRDTLHIKELLSLIRSMGYKVIGTSARQTV